MHSCWLWYPTRWWVCLSFTSYMQFPSLPSLQQVSRKNPHVNWSRRTQQPELWPKNLEKNSHSKGLAYRKGRGVGAAVCEKSVQQCNCDKCRFKCTDSFPEEVRNKIFEDFYALADYSGQKDYIVSNVVEMPIKTRTTSASKHREASRAFYLSYDGLRKRVCGNFFCKTLDLKLRSIQKYLTVHRGRLGLASLSDGRGRHVPRNKTEPWKLDLVRKHIESFPSVESHYCRASTVRRYLDSQLTIKKMYEAFCIFFIQNLPKDKRGSKVPTETVYRNIFCGEYNLSFFVPRKDQYAICLKKRIRW